jgi:hypothetical protein
MFLIPVKVHDCKGKPYRITNLGYILGTGMPHFTDRKKFLDAEFFGIYK